MQALYENNNASRSDLDVALAGKESADAQVSSTQKRLELSQLQLEYTRLTAPFDGSVASLVAERNENVQAGQSIVMLTGVEAVEVEVSIPEILITSIREGSAVTVKFDALPGESLDATVTEVASASAGFATTYPVKVRLNEVTDRVRPGMAAEVTFTFTSTIKTGYFLVPTVAVAEDHLGRFVYIVEEGDGEHWIAHRRDVTVGELTRQGLQLTSGLEDGVRIVTGGVSRITDGQKVKVTGEDSGR
jgi:RND family efflux transporter MFP subunit